MEQPTSQPIEKEETQSLFPILPIALFCLLIGGLGGYFFGRQSAQTAEPTANDSVTATQQDEARPAITPISRSTTVPANNDANNNDPTNAGTNNAGNQPLPTPVTLSPESFTVMGDPDAPVTIVEFSDYQCPFCLRHHQQVLPILKQKYIDTGRVRYIFKDFPIASLHPVADRVHEAALCVGELGGSDPFWQAHDIFFANQQQWADQPQPQLDDILLDLLAETEVNEAEIRDCLASGHNADLVQEDLSEGQQVGVNGTPAFFINGYPLSGARPLEQFELAIQLAEDGKLAEAFAPRQQPTQPAPAGIPADNIPLTEAPIKGDPNAPVTIIEYSDYQCPFCLRHFNQTLPILQQYIDEGKVSYYFKEYPLTSIHPQAPKAHETVRCAQELGGGDEAYWEMHDKLFAEQARWGQAPMGQHVEVLKQMAGEMGYEAEPFAECLDSGRYAGIVNSDIAEGQGYGINGTPTFFINGQRLVGAQPVNAFVQTIEGFLGETE